MASGCWGFLVLMSVPSWCTRFSLPVLNKFVYKMMALKENTALTHSLCFNPISKISVDNVFFLQTRNYVSFFFIYIFWKQPVWLDSDTNTLSYAWGKHHFCFRTPALLTSNIQLKYLPKVMLGHHQPLHLCYMKITDSIEMIMLPGANTQNCFARRYRTSILLHMQPCAFFSVLETTLDVSCL